MSPSLVLFYSNSCFHCQNMKGAWNEFKQQMTGRKLSVQEYESSTFSSLANHSAFGPVVKNLFAVPTIVLFKNDKSNPVYYDGERNVKGFRAFVQQQLKDAGAEKKVVKKKAVAVNKKVAADKPKKAVAVNKKVAADKPKKAATVNKKAVADKPKKTVAVNKKAVADKKAAVEKKPKKAAPKKKAAYRGGFIRDGVFLPTLNKH